MASLICGVLPLMASITLLMFSRFFSRDAKSARFSEASLSIARSSFIAFDKISLSLDEGYGVAGTRFA